MSRQVDLSSPLSERDKKYLRDMGQDSLIAQVEAGGEDSSATASNVTLGDSLALEKVPNTGDVDTLGRGDQGGAQGPEDQAPSGDYDSLTVKQLQAELARRDLSTTGNKPDLIARLEADDDSADDDDEGQQAGDALDGDDEGDDEQ